MPAGYAPRRASRTRICSDRVWGAERNPEKSMHPLKHLLGVAALLLLAGALHAGKPAPPKPTPPPKPVPITDKHFRVYDAKGTPATLEAVVQRMRAVDVVFLGESHDDPVAHHLERELLRRLQEARVKQPGPLPPRPLAL